jgi:hypothetical protein
MKKLFSILISVPVLSLVIFALAFLVVLFADVNSPGDKIGGNFILALVIAFGLVVLVWIGAGIEFALSRIRHKPMRIAATLGTFVFVPSFLCIGLPLLAAVAGVNLLSSAPTWKALPATSDKAIEVVGADHITVYVRTTSGNFVRCFVTQPTSCWQPTSKPTTRVLVGNANQRETANAPAVQPPGQLVSLLGVDYGYGGGIPMGIHYAVLTDGSVWYLQKDTTGDSLTFAALLALPVLAAAVLAGWVVIYLGAGVNALSRFLAGKRQATS